MAVHRLLLASPVLFGMLAVAVPHVSADDSSAAPTTNKDWFRPDEAPAASTRDTNTGGGRDSDVTRRSGDNSRDNDRDNGRDVTRRRDDGGYGGGSGPAWGHDDDDRYDSRGSNQRRSYSPVNNNSEYPSQDVNDWVFANARAATARAIFSRAENDLAAAYRRAQHNFDRSKGYREAAVAEKDAYENYTAARQEALRSLANDAKYRTLLQLRDDLSEKLAIRRAQKDITKDEVIALATLKMNYASDARSMEVAAVGADQAVTDARQKMVAASQKSTQMRADFDDSLRDNRDIIAAHMNLEDARIALITAQAYLAGAATAGAAATDYAYYTHRDGGYSPYAYGYGNGYGLGYGSPFWGR